MNERIKNFESKFRVDLINIFLMSLECLFQLNLQIHNDN